MDKTVEWSWATRWDLTSELWHIAQLQVAEIRPLSKLLQDLWVIELAIDVISVQLEVLDEGIDSERLDDIKEGALHARVREIEMSDVPIFVAVVARRVADFVGIVDEGKHASALSLRAAIVPDGLKELHSKVKWSYCTLHKPRALRARPAPALWCLVLKPCASAFQHSGTTNSGCVLAILLVARSVWLGWRVSWARERTSSNSCSTRTAEEEPHPNGSP
jgi:hypothetical protein